MSASELNVSSRKRILDKVRHGLLIQVFRNQLRRIGIEFTPFYLTQVGTEMKKMPEIKDNQKQYSHGFLGEKDLIRMNNDPRGYSIDKLLAHLKKGRKCYGVKRKNEVAAFVWIDYNECNFEPIRFPLKEDEVYTFSAYTMEGFRGKNIAPYMAYHCYNELRSSGHHKIYSITEYFNRSAMRYKLKLGTKKLRLYLHIGLFNRTNRLFLLKKYA